MKTTIGERCPHDRGNTATPQQLWSDPNSLELGDQLHFDGGAKGQGD